MSNFTCGLRQYSDLMVCDYCGLRFDVNDPSPPNCRVDENGQPLKSAKIVGFAVRVPAQLPVKARKLLNLFRKTSHS